MCATRGDLYKTMVISIVNLLYKIKLDDKRWKVAAKSLRKTKISYLLYR